MHQPGAYGSPTALLVPFLFQKVKVQEHLREPWDGSMTLCTVHA